MGKKNKPTKFRSIGGWISTLMLLMILLSSAVIGTSGYISYRSEAIASRGQFMRTVATDMAKFLDAEQVEEMLRTGVKTDYWYEVKDRLDEMMATYGLKYLYILENYNLGNYRYFAEGELTPGDGLDFGYVESKEEYGVLEPLINQVFLSKDSFYSDLYESGDYGVVVSGIAPVIDKNGNVPVVVGADIASSSVLESTNRFLMQLSIATAFFCCLFYIISHLFVRSRLTRPLAALAGTFTHLGDGVIDPAMNARTNDEIGILANGYARTSAAIQSLVDGLHKMSEEHMLGHSDYRMDPSHFYGVYQEVATGLNEMVGSYVVESEHLVRALGSFAGGEFRVALPRFPGKKAMANVAVDKLSHCLIEVNHELTRLVHAVTEGALSERIDEAAFEGDWQKLTRRTNRLLNAVADPIRESAGAIHKMADGYLDARVSGDYKGDFGNLKDSMNLMGEELNGYISEMKEILMAIGASNLNQEIKRNYVGQFSEMRNSINAILTSLNDVMRQFDKSAESVAHGSTQLADFSQRLSQNSSEQDGIVKDLAGFIAQIDERASKNEEDAESANRISVTSKENAEIGNREMEHMVKAMEMIRESSNSISKVVKAISDIAFQTNLLAINASVEAAHAGQNGKGFAVVAEQVRTLAVRSQAAARETADLVGKSIDLVNTGATLATRTEGALSNIFKNISDVSGIIENIAVSSKEQTRAIHEISRGLERIETSVHGVAADSEHCAALSQTLANEATEFKSMIEQFELRKEERR